MQSFLLTEIRLVQHRVGFTVKFNVDEINFELLLGLDTNKERRTTTGGDDFVGIMARLEDERERTLKLLQDRLDELSEAQTLVGLLAVDVLAEDRDGLSISLGFKVIATLLQKETQGDRVRDDAVVHNRELSLGVRLEGVAVDNGWLSVGRPSCVRDRDLRDEGLARVDVGLRDLLAQAVDLANLLEEDHVAWLVAIDADTSGVVSAVLLPRQAIDKDVADGLTVLLRACQRWSGQQQRFSRITFSCR